MSQAGDGGFLLSEGYTVAWIGWQGDIAPGGGLRIEVPAVPDVSGRSREEWVFDHVRSPVQAELTYPAADPDPAKARLTVRARVGDPRATPSDLSFRFLDPRTIEIVRPQGFDGSALYELTYGARDPKVMGLGLAAIRDVAAFLRRDGSAQNPLAADGRSGIDHAIAVGISQSGRVLRDVLYLGFNEDEAGRIVFDGMLPYIAGSRRSFTNARFAQPSRNPAPHTDRLYPADQFPFAYAVTTDALTGRRDGLLCAAGSRTPARGSCTRFRVRAVGLARLAVGDRHARLPPRSPARGAGLPDHRRAASRARRRDHPAEPDLRAADEPGLRRRAGPRPAHGARRLGRRVRRAAGEPLSDPGGRHPRARRPSLPRDPGAAVPGAP